MIDEKGEITLKKKRNLMLHEKWHKLLLEHRGLEFKTITMIEVRAKDFIYFIKSKLKHDIMTMSIK